MRLIEVELENYKHYAGTHVFRPGEKAMVAIVGQNGAGKTTLFEAIEWCLYNPSHIKNDSLTPRVQGGKPRVRVVLEDVAHGITYEIERSYKGGSTKAEIYRLDRPESPLVQGTRQVTDYVTRELTGLPHAAFVSTFFTKQKELSFFGDMGATERREQVGRLLGLETIRVAQKSIGEKRTRKLAEAKVKRDQYEEQTRGVDFAAERARLDAIIADQTAQRDAARTEVESRKRETAAASAVRDAAQRRYAANAELLRSLERVDGDSRRFEEMRITAQRDLAAIDGAALEIGRQQTEAANEPALRALLERHETEKQKAETADRLTKELDRLLIERQSLVSVLPPSGGAPGTGDAPTVAAATALIPAFDAEIARLAGIDLAAMRHRLEVARQLLGLDEQRSSAKTKLDKMEALADDLRRQVEKLVADGLPAERLKAIQNERAELQQGASAAMSVAAQTELRARQLRTLEQSLRSSEFGELCPTCARPFQPGEAMATLDALGEQVRLLDEEIRAERATGERLTQRAAGLVTVEKQLSAEAELYQNLTGRLENGRGVIKTQQDELDTFEHELALRLRDAGESQVPAREQIDQLDRAAQQADAECALRPRLEMARERLIGTIQQQQTIEEHLRSFGPIAYDQVAHNRDYAAWATARDAVARIEELGKQVAQRPDREAALAHSVTQLATLAAERARLDAEIVTLAFDPEELEQANRGVATAIDRERCANDAAHLAERQLSQAQWDRDELDKTAARLEALNAESIAAQADHAELSRVYSEFARFEKFVALVVTPHLSEIASGLLSTVTDGKYDRLEFTEDYGIEVYDGEADRFPLSQYSGGERDVIALCARLALSQVIGGQAAMPLQFMVLDEVFGSLDVDRRRNLMEMLQRLMEESHAFQQLFVISHVDDVKAGAMFDEVWRVSETADGVSQLEQVSVTGALEDY